MPRLIMRVTADKKINLLAPVVRGRKGHYRELFEEIRKKGFVKAGVDGAILTTIIIWRVMRVI